MKFPKILLILTGILASSLFFVGAFIYYAVKNKSLLGGIAAGIAGANAVGTVFAMGGICSLASFHPREYFSLERKITQFFDLGVSDLLHKTEKTK